MAGLLGIEWGLWEIASRERVHSETGQYYSTPVDALCERLGCDLHQLNEAVLRLEIAELTAKIDTEVNGMLVLRVVRPMRVVSAANRFVEVTS